MDTSSYTITASAAQLPGRDIQHAWFEITRSRIFRSIAFVPTDDNYSTLHIATEIAHMASLDPKHKILLINATNALYSQVYTAPSAAKVLPESAIVRVGNYSVLDCGKSGLDDATVGMIEIPKHMDAIENKTGVYSLLIVAANSLLQRPALVSAARSVDAVVLCVPLGESRLPQVRQTMDLVGEERIVGSIAVKRS